MEKIITKQAASAVSDKIIFCNDCVFKVRAPYGSVGISVVFYPQVFVLAGFR